MPRYEMKVDLNIHYLLIILQFLLMFTIFPELQLQATVRYKQLLFFSRGVIRRASFFSRGAQSHLTVLSAETPLETIDFTAPGGGAVLPAPTPKFALITLFTLLSFTSIVKEQDEALLPLLRSRTKTRWGAGGGHVSVLSRDIRNPGSTHFISAS